MRRRLDLLLILSAIVATSCAEPDPNYGEPGGIIGRPLPQEPSSGGTSGGTNTGPFGTATSPALTTTMKDAHAAKSAPAPDVVPECLGCHGKAGAGSTIKWSYAGRVMDGAAPVPDVDIIVEKGATKIGPVKTDKDGFFWAPIALGEVPDGAKVHVRKGTVINSMTSALTAAKGGGCNATPGCHATTGGVGPVHP